MIDAVAVIVPVHDEGAHLAACLTAIEASFAALPETVSRVAVVVLDACSDESEDVARRWTRDAPAAHGVVIAVDFRNVGRARNGGMSAALERLGGHAAQRVWLATTDADSRVPRAWLNDQIAMANDGVDAIAGSIEVDDWSEHGPGMAQRFADFYCPPGSGETHAHVHGANLGVRADAYLVAGGFEPLATGEDHALWRALHRASRRRVSSRHIAVVTSARTLGRAPDGFSAFLGDFAAASS